MQMNCKENKVSLDFVMEKITEEIKKLGIKITTPRKKILQVLKKSQSPLSLGEIHEKLNSVDFASIFRNIKLFCSLNVVREINMGDKKIRYELINAEHCHHIICSECGRIEKLNVCFLGKIQNLTDYKITAHHMEFVGVCPKCK